MQAAGLEFLPQLWRLNIKDEYRYEMRYHMQSYGEEKKKKY